MRSDLKNFHMATPNGGPARTPKQREAERDIEALRILDDRLKNRWSHRQLAVRWNRDENTIKRRIDRAIQLSQITDARASVISDLLPMSHIVYKNGLAEGADPNRQERMAHDVMFGLGVLTKHPPEREVVEPPDEMTLAVWREQFDQQAQPAIEGEVQDERDDESHRGLQLAADAGAAGDGEPGAALPGDGPDPREAPDDRDLSE